MLRTFCILAEKIVPVQCTKEMLGFFIIDHQTLSSNHSLASTRTLESKFVKVWSSCHQAGNKTGNKASNLAYLWWYQKVEKCLLGVVLGETTDNHQSILPNSGENNIMLSSSSILVHRGMVAEKIVLWESTVFYFNCFKLLTPTVSPKRSL